MSSCQQLFHISSQLLSRAITACLPASSLQSVQQIAVTVRNKSQALHSPLVSITVSDTGTALPDDLKVLKLLFSHVFDKGADMLCNQELQVKSTECHESSIRVYKVVPASKNASNVAVTVTRLVSVAKQSRRPFEGSEVSFHLLPEANADDVIGCVQAVLELSSMIAARVKVELRLKNFALRGDAEDQPGNVIMQYDLEPLPADLSTEQRFFEGLRAWFDNEDLDLQDSQAETGLSQALQPTGLDPEPQQSAERTAAHGSAAIQEDLLEVQMPDGSMHYMTEQEFISQTSSMQHSTEQEGMLQSHSSQYPTGPQHPSRGPSPCDPAYQHSHCSIQDGPPNDTAMPDHGDENDQPNTAHGQFVEHARQPPPGMHQSVQHLRSCQSGAGQPEASGNLVNNPFSEHSYGAENGHGHGHVHGMGYGHASGHEIEEHDRQLSASQQAGVMHRDPAGMQLASAPAQTALQDSLGKPQTAMAIGQAGADGQADIMGQQGAMLQRSKWTAQAGLVLHSQVPSPLAGYVLPPGQAQVYLFQNWSLLQRAPDSCLKALDKFAWQNFGLAVEVQALPSGVITLTFGQKSDALSQDISALVLHLYHGQAKQEATTGKSPALAAVTEAKMIKVALEAALTKLKSHFQGSLGNKVERKLQQCIPYLAKSITKLVSHSDNLELQHNACALMSCQLEHLQQEMEYRLEEASAAELQARVSHAHSSHATQQLPMHLDDHLMHIQY